MRRSPPSVQVEADRRIIDRRSGRNLGPARTPYIAKEARVNARNGPLLPREEQQLVDGLIAGSDDALRTLYARFSRPVYTMGLRLLGTREAAEELTQDAFGTAWRQAAPFDP